VDVVRGERGSLLKKNSYCKLKKGSAREVGRGSGCHDLGKATTTILNSLLVSTRTKDKLRRGKEENKKEIREKIGVAVLVPKRMKLKKRR